MNHDHPSLLSISETRILFWEFSSREARADEFQHLIRSEALPQVEFWRIAGSAQAILTECQTLDPHLLLLGINSDDIGAGAEALEELRDRNLLSPILVITDAQEEHELSELLEAGASDFLVFPFRKPEVLARLSRYLRKLSRFNSEPAGAMQELGLTQIKGASPALQRQICMARRFANSDATVLICGETGTGKEVFARGIHQAGLRAANPFVPVNCGALPVDLVENELFGHEAGAFTGARREHGGLIHQAERGTLFLDEIDSLPMSAQSKLLRFLQQREYRPLGAARTRQADVRVISASNRNLPEAVRSGHFRQDLFFRLSVLPLRLPALREHPEDILLLAKHILLRHREKFSASGRAFTNDSLRMETLPFNRHSNVLTPAAIKKLMDYDWPGNVRELENVLERALVVALGPTVDGADIDIPTRKARPSHESFRDWKAKTIYELEDLFLRDVLEKHGGNITQAARSARIERRTFYALLQKHKLTRNSEKPGHRLRV